LVQEIDSKSNLSDETNLTSATAAAGGGGVSSWAVATAVNNTASVSGDRLYFTTQHEQNFIAAYDGFLIRAPSASLIRFRARESSFRASSFRERESSASPLSSLEDAPHPLPEPSENAAEPSVTVSVYEDGFLPKYLNNKTVHAYGWSAFRYNDGLYPTITGDMVFYSSCSYMTDDITVGPTARYNEAKSDCENIHKATLSPTNQAALSMSDHLAVGARFRHVF
jgi:hypothetical protein